MLKKEKFSRYTKCIKLISITLRIHVINTITSSVVSRTQLSRTLFNITSFRHVIKGFGLRRESASNVSQRHSMPEAWQLHSEN